MNLPGLIFVVMLCVTDGLVIYGVYSHCDIGVHGLKEVTSNDKVASGQLSSVKIVTITFFLFLITWRFLGFHI